MKELREKIEAEIRKLRTYEATQTTYMATRRANPVAYQYDVLGMLTTRINRIKSWMAMLPENEAYVVKRRLVDGLEWEQIVREYQRLWGGEKEPVVKILGAQQRGALQRIEWFVMEHSQWYVDFLELDEEDASTGDDRQRVPWQSCG